MPQSARIRPALTEPIFGNAKRTSRTLAVRTHSGGRARTCASSIFPDARSFFSCALADRISLASRSARRRCSRDLPGTRASAECPEVTFGPGDSVPPSEGSASDGSAGSELIAGGGASDRSPNQPAPTQRERRKHVLAPVAPPIRRGSGSVARSFFRKAPDPHRHPTSFVGSYSPDVRTDAHMPCSVLHPTGSARGRRGHGKRGRGVCSPRVSQRPKGGGVRRVSITVNGAEHTLELDRA